MSVRLGVVLSIAACVLMVGWHFVPATVTYKGSEIRCVSASIDRSSPESELDDHQLACRPMAATRELQVYAGMAISLVVIWGAYGVLAARDGSRTKPE